MVYRTGLSVCCGTHLMQLYVFFPFFFFFFCFKKQLNILVKQMEISAMTYTSSTVVIYEIYYKKLY